MHCLELRKGKFGQFFLSCLFQCMFFYYSTKTMQCGFSPAFLSSSEDILIANSYSICVFGQSKTFCQPLAQNYKKCIWAISYSWFRQNKIKSSLANMLRIQIKKFHSHLKPKWEDLEDKMIWWEGPISLWDISAGEQSRQNVSSIYWGAAFFKMPSSGSLCKSFSALPMKLLIVKPEFLPTNSWLLSSGFHVVSSQICAQWQIWWVIKVSLPCE
jgi:hypothetical protein